jgi:hypothetical protein
MPPVPWIRWRHCCLNLRQKQKRHFVSSVTHTGAGQGVVFTCWPPIPREDSGNEAEPSVFHHPGGFAVCTPRTANLSTVAAESQLGLAESDIQLDAIDFPS